MDASEMVTELTEYFNGNYSPMLLRKIRETCDNIPDQDRRRIIEQVEEDNAPNFKLGVSGIADACKKLRIPFHKVADFYIPAINWTCEACGLSFQYAQVVDYEQKHDKGIFDYCPRCGFPPIETMEAQKIAAMQRGETPKGHLENIAQYLRGFEKRRAEESRKPQGHKRYSGWMFDKQEDDDYVSMRRREEIEAMKRAAQEEVRRLDAAKRNAVMSEQKAKEEGR